ncbi:putative necrosis-inducing factor-domain-containing protein [Lasiosphaeria ovina]|uniref:Necrosis-inducing factor-domain-containing protein n=1 Tax=Lasiosphaeria ovina TaxID=92902 RepID=A0AAE0JU61_9PEZI|nr:putative necrosis-inducing factor-domain-containing protein [Lasiosphaeria ovina]
MKLAAAVAALFAAAHAAPAPAANATDGGFILAPNSDTLTYTPGPSSAARSLTERAINDCDNSSFENQSTGGSPTVGDCQRLANNIAGDGTWTVWTGTQHQIAQYGTCAFGITTVTGFWANIGNGDVRDIIGDSIRRFQWNGLVGAKGEMNCQGSGSPHVKWAIYHT